MHKVVLYLLSAFVFTQPWDSVSLPGVGALSRVIGVVTLGAAVVTKGMEGRLRRPNAVFWLACMMVAYSALSLLWTVSPGSTTQRVMTYAQLLGSLWLMQEFVRTREQHQSLLFAFCLGAFVPMLDLLNNFRAGNKVSQWGNRFSADGLLRANADNLGLTLVIALPIAWYLIQNRGGAVRVLSLLYFVLAPIAVVLTAARGAFLAGIVGLSVIPLSLPRQSARSAFLVIGLLIVLLATVSMVVPPVIWARIVTIPTEITGGGGLTGRTDIWKAGITVFWGHMLLGVGAGAYGVAVQPYTYFPHAPHNMAIGMLVELGVVGFVIFAALLGACARTIWRLPSAERTFWMPLMLSWLVGVMSLNFEESKVTWLLYGLLAAQTAAGATRPVIVQPQRKRAVPAARPELLTPVHSRGMAQVSRSR